MTQKTTTAINNGLNCLRCGLQIIGQTSLLIFCLGALYLAMAVMA